jgi:pimeloyl-ACP methyl ester carboxylesterase
VGETIDEESPPGSNYDKADFRLWYPQGSPRVRAVLVLVPGSNDDGRSMVSDPLWQAFARRQRLALVGCRFTDKPHEQDFIEEYVDVSRGSGQALLNALAALAERSKHPELAAAPLLLWGISAGGEFNYEFTAWKPERVVAFVVNKGGIYYTALTRPEARKVPGIFFTGGRDLESRTATIVGLFELNRRCGALWALAEEPAAGHVFDRSRDVAQVFFEDLLAIRVTASLRGTGEPALRPVVLETGFLGDLKAKSFKAAVGPTESTYPTAWLPTIRTAHAWQAIITGKPLDRKMIEN